MQLSRDDQYKVINMNRFKFVTHAVPVLLVLVSGCTDHIPTGPDPGSSLFPNTVAESKDVGNSPRGICSLPSEEYVYVASRLGDNVSVIQ